MTRRRVLIVAVVATLVWGPVPIASVPALIGTEPEADAAVDAIVLPPCSHTPPGVGAFPNPSYGFTGGPGLDSMRAMVQGLVDHECAFGGGWEPWFTDEWTVPAVQFTSSPDTLVYQPDGGSEQITVSVSSQHIYTQTGQPGTTFSFDGPWVNKVVWTHVAGSNNGRMWWRKTDNDGEWTAWDEVGFSNSPFTLNDVGTCQFDDGSCTYDLTWTPEPFVQNFKYKNRIMQVGLRQHWQAVGTCGAEQGSPHDCVLASGDAIVPLLLLASTPPAAVFDYTATPNRPGHFQFDATASHDPDGGNIATYEWDFGDGSTGSGFLEQHQYETPGTYYVTLTVTDDEFTEHETTKQVVVPAPTLDLGITFPGSADQLFEKDEEFDARVTVSAGDDGVGDLSELNFVGAPIEFPASILELVSGPIRTASGEDITLAPGDNAVFDYRFKAIAAGRFTLRSTIQGKDAADRVVGPKSTDRSGKVGEIDVEVVPDKTEIELEDDDDGPVPKRDDVTVKVTNPTDEELTSVELSLLEPDIVTEIERDPLQIPFTYLVENPQIGPGLPLLIPGLPDPVDLGAIAPGETKEHTFPAQAQDDGTVELHAVVVANADGNTLTGAGSEKVKVLTDVLLFFESEARGLSGHPRGEGWIDGGGQWDVVGEFENRSADEDVLALIQPKLEGNAIYAVPHPVTGQAPTDQTCGVGILQNLEPGETVRFVAPVRTHADGGTRGTVDYSVRGFLTDDEGNRTEIPQEKVRFSDETRPPHVSHVEVFDPIPEATTGELVYTFWVGSMEGFGRFIEGWISLGSLALQALGTLATPWNWPAAWRAAGEKMSEYVSHIYENLSEAEKEEWKTGIVNHFAIIADKSVGELTTLVNTAVEQKFTELTTAWETGDSRAVAEWWGEFAGENPDLILEVLAGGYGLCRLASRGATFARNGLARKGASQAENLERRAAAGVRFLDNGDRLAYSSHLRQLFAIDERMHKLMLQLAKAENLIVVVRRRGFRAIEKIATGRYAPKPLSVKAKNVNFRDSDFLGMKLANGTDLVDEVAIGPPPPWETVKSRLDASGADPDLVASTRARWESRTKEWPKEMAKWLEYEKNGIPYPKKAVGVDYRENFEWGWFVDNSEINVHRPFRIERGTTPDGQPLWRPQICSRPAGCAPGGEPADGWQYVTGDIDPMAFLKPDGTPPDEATRFDLYKKLGDYGFEHPESMMWNNDIGRNDYFNEFGAHLPNTEAMAAYMPDGTVRATRFDPNKSWIDESDFRNINRSMMYLRGATTAIVSDDTVIADIPIPPETEPYISPTIFLTPDGCPGAGGARRGAQVGCTLNASRDPAAPVLRIREDGTIELWTPATGWVPVLEVPGGEFRTHTVVTETSDGAGGDTLEIRTFEELGFTEGVDGWFEPGDVVVIDPGGPNEEYVTVGGFGSLVLTEPLMRPHSAGELVVLVEPVPPKVALPGGGGGGGGGGGAVDVPGTGSGPAGSLAPVGGALDHADLATSLDFDLPATNGHHDLPETNGERGTSGADDQGQRAGAAPDGPATDGVGAGVWLTIVGAVLTLLTLLVLALHRRSQQP